MGEAERSSFDKAAAEEEAVKKAAAKGQNSTLENRCQESEHKIQIAPQEKWELENLTDEKSILSSQNAALQALYRDAEYEMQRARDSRREFEHITATLREENNRLTIINHGLIE